MNLPNSVHWPNIVAQVVNQTRTPACIQLMKSSLRGGDAFFLIVTEAPKVFVKKLVVSVGWRGGKPY